MVEDRVGKKEPKLHITTELYSIMEFMWPYPQIAPVDSLTNKE